jgi:hypothetical protein
MSVYIVAGEFTKYGGYMCIMLPQKVNDIDTGLGLRSLFKFPVLIAEL